MTALMVAACRPVRVHLVLGGPTRREDPPRRAHPARGDPHRVDLLDVLPREDAGHARERPGEVEAEDRAPGRRPPIGRPEIG